MQQKKQQMLSTTFSFSMQTMVPQEQLNPQQWMMMSLFSDFMQTFKNMSSSNQVNKQQSMWTKKKEKKRENVDCEIFFPTFFLGISTCSRSFIHSTNHPDLSAEQQPQ